VIKSGEQNLVKNHQKQVKDIYLKKQIKALTPQEYAATTKAKRAGKAKGKQFVAQPKSIKSKVKAI
jgi:hypothetical protein